MAGMIGWLKRFGGDESGQDLVEYALIVAVLGLGAIATLKGVANSVATVFTAVGTTLTTAL
jgi:pilus assembly protein Flp/PilA